jgi:hypothetical protein
MFDTGAKYILTNCRIESGTNDEGVKGDDEAHDRGIAGQETVTMISGCIRRAAEGVGRQSRLDIHPSSGHRCRDWPISAEL